METKKNMLESKIMCRWKFGIITLRNIKCSLKDFSKSANNIRQNYVILGHLSFNAEHSKAENDLKMKGIYNYAWKSKSGLTKTNTLNQNMVASRPKKRKSATFLQSPWYKVYLQGSELCHNIRSFVRPI